MCHACNSPWNVTFTGRIFPVALCLCYAWTRHLLHTHGLSWPMLLPYWWLVRNLGSTSCGPALLFESPMSDLSTLLNGISVHPGDQCLTTLRFLSTRASRDTGPRCSWDPTYMPPTLLVVNDARGLVGTDTIPQHFKKPFSKQFT